MNKKTGDERVIPSGWLGQRGGDGGSGRGLLLGGFVVSHGVNAGEVVEAEADGDGDGSGAVASRRSPKTLLPFSRAGSQMTLPTNRARGHRDGIAESSTERGTVDDG